jgi:hypothetical protein
MVLLMLLRRMPEYPASLMAGRGWSDRACPSALILGSRVTVLGTGDRGHRLCPAGPGWLGAGPGWPGVSRSGRARTPSSFDAAVPPSDPKLDERSACRRTILAMALPGTPETVGDDQSWDRRRIATAGPRGHLYVNVGRGSGRWIRTALIGGAEQRAAWPARRWT